MAEEGVELLARVEDLAVMGFVEVLARIRYFWALERRILRVIRDEKVDLVVPVDYPGLNLRIIFSASPGGSVARSGTFRARPSEILVG